MIRRKTQLRGVVVEVSAPMTTPVGVKLPMSVTVQNGAQEVVTCGDTGYFPSCRATLIDTRTGQVCPFTDNGRHTLTGDANYRGQYSMVPLSAGESNTWSADLNLFYSLKPGTYDMMLAVEMNPNEGQKSFDIIVDKLKFKITD